MDTQIWGQNYGNVELHILYIGFWVLAWNFALAIHISVNSQVLYVVYKRQILLTTGKSNEAKQSNKTEIRKCLICYNNMKNVIRAHFI